MGLQAVLKKKENMSIVIFLFCFCSARSGFISDALSEFLLPKTNTIVRSVTLPQGSDGRKEYSAAITL